MNRTNYTRIETKNSLPQSIRLQSVGLLNRNLASAIDLERQAKQAHWNVKGPGPRRHRSAAQAPQMADRSHRHQDRHLADL